MTALERWTPHRCQTGCSTWPTLRATDGERGGRGDLLAKVRTGQTSRRKEWTEQAHTHTGEVSLIPRGSNGSWASPPAGRRWTSD